MPTWPCHSGGTRRWMWVNCVPGCECRGGHRVTARSASDTLAQRYTPPGQHSSVHPSLSDVQQYGGPSHHFQPSPRPRKGRTVDAGRWGGGGAGRRQSGGQCRCPSYFNLHGALHSAAFGSLWSLLFWLASWHPSLLAPRPDGQSATEPGGGRLRRVPSSSSLAACAAPPHHAGKASIGMPGWHTQRRGAEAPLCQHFWALPTGPPSWRSAVAPAARHSRVGKSPGMTSV